MSRSSRMGTIVAVLAITAVLAVPASSAVAGGVESGGGPVATKSGALVNYTTTGKLRIAKKIFVPFVCAANCSVVSTLALKGPGVKLTDTQSATLNAGFVAAHFIQPNGPLSRALRASPGRFKVVSSVTATDLATGATDAISNAFRLKR